MLFKNPLQKEKTITQKVGDALHLPHKQTPAEKALIIVQRIAIYLAIFLAGYMVAKLQMLMNI